MNLLQQNPHLQSRNSFEVLDTLDDVQNICQSIQTLINSNEDKLNHLENFVTINKLFVQFHQNFEVIICFSIIERFLIIFHA